jgi:NAD(P)-dependent dehydrogenase (short-subunit alcohol dehydrogenase family)
MDIPLCVDLKGKVAVVTGGSGVLCSAMASALGACGAKVAVLGRNFEKAKAVSDAIISRGGVSAPYACDVLDKAALEKTAERITAELGPCDILVNGAGGTHPKGITTKEYLDIPDLENGDIATFFDLTTEGFNYVFGLNLMGTVIPCQVFGRQMAGRKDCTIINISSMGAFQPLTKSPAYSGAKAAVSNFTQWLAVHFSKVGIRVNAIAPGFFITEQNRDLLIQPDGQLTARSKKVIAKTPMERFGKAEELVGTLLWLVEPKASGFVTGVIIPVDGGFSAFNGV